MLINVIEVLLLIHLAFTKIKAFDHSLSSIKSNSIGLNRLEDVLYVDNDIIAYNKPPNLLSVPGLYDKDSLASRAVKTFGLDRADKIIVHRLDYHTSGVIIFAKNEFSLRRINEQFRSKNSMVYKKYKAVVKGVPSSLHGEIDLPLGRDEVKLPPYNKVDINGSPSRTTWHVEAVKSNCTLLSLIPHTGRTHQLRIHMAAIGYPILGDYFYAPKEVLDLSPDRLLLHSESLHLFHPRTNKHIGFYAPAIFSKDF